MISSFWLWIILGIFITNNRTSYFRWKIFKSKKKIVLNNSISTWIDSADESMSMNLCIIKNCYIAQRISPGYFLLKKIKWNKFHLLWNSLHFVMFRWQQRNFDYTNQKLLVSFLECWWIFDWLWRFALRHEHFRSRKMLWSARKGVCSVHCLIFIWIWKKKSL